MTDVTIQSPTADIVGIQLLPVQSVELTQQQHGAVEIISSAGMVIAIPESASIVTVEQPAQSVVDVLTAGPQGPPGPPGKDGYIPPRSPVFTYLPGGSVSRIDYDDGRYKVFSYGAGDMLMQLDYINGAVTVRKEFVYSAGKLQSITETEIF